MIWGSIIFCKKLNLFLISHFRKNCTFLLELTYSKRTFNWYIQGRRVKIFSAMSSPFYSVDHDIQYSLFTEPNTQPNILNQKISKQNFAHLTTDTI